jgi:hypothetical protein
MTTATKPTIQKMTVEQVMRRWLRIIAHLIASSLGYFSPQSAANAIRSVKRNGAFACEWYCDWADKARENDPKKYECQTFEQTLLEVGKESLLKAIRNRHYHRDYMASYQKARKIIERELTTGESPNFGSWF